MTNSFDHQSINHVTTAISHEMNPRRAKRHDDFDTVFIGGPTPSEADADELGFFGQRGNWKIIFPAFDTANPAAGPTGFHAIITDGVAETFVLSRGRLWKRDRSCPAVLLFPDASLLVRLNTKGKLVVREMTGPYSDHGYELALSAVLARAARKPGTVPVVSPIGSLVTVLDMKALSAMFAAGE